jgi:hypothetical protein
MERSEKLMLLKQVLGGKISRQEFVLKLVKNQTTTVIKKGNQYHIEGIVVSKEELDNILEKNNYSCILTLPSNGRELIDWPND